MIEQIHERGTRLLRLRAKLKARDGVAGYEKNCEALRERISLLENSNSTVSEAVSDDQPVASTGEGSNREKSGKVTP